MPRCPLPAALGFVLLALNTSAEDPAVTPRSALRAAMRDELKSKVQGKPVETIPVDDKPPADTVTMAPYVVAEKRTPRIAGLDEAMQKEKALESHALYHTDVTKKVRIEMGLPPAPGGRGG